MTHIVPVECKVVLQICVRDVKDRPTAASKAKEYWKKKYEDDNQAPFVEGTYVKGSAKVLTNQIKTDRVWTPPRFTPYFLLVHPQTETKE
uniref:Uncharacterized protein n=1 Tax=viral metagenome TaxID=1070528 RepID=A0A6M3KXB4_9ZZZZ